MKLPGRRKCFSLNKREPPSYLFFLFEDESVVVGM